MFFGQYADEYFNMTSPTEIYSACRNVFSSVLKDKPDRIDKKGTELAKKYEDLKFLKLDPDDKIMGKYLAKKKNIFCTIVIPASIEQTFLITTVHINFYKMNKHSEAEPYEQVIICSGTSACLFGQGDPGEIENLIQALNSGGSDKEETQKTRKGSNKFKAVKIAGSLFILGCGGVYFLKRNNFI